VNSAAIFKIHGNSRRKDSMIDQVDVPKRRGRPRTRPRTPILSAEQVLGLQTPAQKTTAEEKERERLRGIARRADAKVRESMSQAETIQEFWAKSRKLAEPQKLVEWQTRQEYVEALLDDIRTALEGRSPDPEFIQDVDDELKSDIAEFGEAGITPILLIGKFWQNPDLLAQLTKDDSPSSLFAKFGVLVALPDLKVHQWNEFMAHRTTQTATAPSGNGYTVMACTSCDLMTGVVAASDSIRDRYIELGIPFRCQRCRDLERKSRAQSTLYGGSR
jgi:hypothetical protein